MNISKPGYMITLLCKKGNSAPHLVKKPPFLSLRTPPPTHTLYSPYFNIIYLIHTQYGIQNIYIHRIEKVHQIDIIVDSIQ